MTPCQQGSLTLSRATSFPCLFSLHLRVAVDCDTLSDPTRSTDSVQAPFYQCKQPLEQQNKWYALQASQHTPGRPGIPSGPWRWPSAACPPFASGAWPGPAPCRTVQLLGSHVPRLMKMAAWRMRVRSWMPPFPPLTHGFAPHESPGEKLSLVAAAGEDGAALVDLCSRSSDPEAQASTKPWRN